MYRLRIKLKLRYAILCVILLYYIYKLLLFIGKEFVAQTIKNLAIEWPGLCIINGRPRHPQSQGLIERANWDLTRRLGKMVHSTGKDWPDALKFTVYGLNTSISTVTGILHYITNYIYFF